MASKKRDGLYKRGDFWWLRTDPLTGRPASTKCRDYEAAKRWRAQRERLAADPAHAAAQTSKLAEWVARIIESKQRAGKADATVNIYSEKLGHWLRIFGVDATLAEVGTPESIDVYVLQRREEEVTDHTICKELSKLIAVLKMAKRRGAFAGDTEVLWPEDLAAGYVPKERALPRSEVMLLLAQLEPHRAALPAICIAFGCRLSEARKITQADIDLERGRAFVDGTKTPGSKRWIPILSVFRPLVELAYPHLPLKPWDKYWRDIQNACVRAKIDPCSPNDFRRTHATILKEAGVDSDVVRRLLGHKTRALLDKVYAHPSTESQAELAEERLVGAVPVAGEAKLTAAAHKLRAEQAKLERQLVGAVVGAPKLAAAAKVEAKTAVVRIHPTLQIRYNGFVGLGSDHGFGMFSARPSGFEPLTFGSGGRTWPLALPTETAFSSDFSSVVEAEEGRETAPIATRTLQCWAFAVVRDPFGRVAAERVLSGSSVRVMKGRLASRRKGARRVG